MNSGVAWEIVKLIFYLFIFAVVIWATYYTCKKLAAHGSNFGSSKYMKIMDRMMLGKDVGIAVIKIGTGYLLVSQTSEGISLLREFSEEEFREMELLAPQTNQTQNPFINVFENETLGKVFGVFGSKKSKVGNNGFDFSRFFKKQDNDGEILGTYDGDLTDAQNIDFDAILKKGMRNSAGTDALIKSKREKNVNSKELGKDAVDEILESVDKRKRSFDLRKEENNAADEG